MVHLPTHGPPLPCTKWKLISSPPSNLVIPAILAMMELAETFIFAHHVIKVVMVWHGLLKRERRNDLERVYQDNSWNLNVAFHGLSTRLCVAMTIIVCHVAMTMIVCHM